ncbi:MAG: HEAT repeat domain-containing protein [Planctomycetota bacterium]|nr:HEAT repeat domain-containing protein [Planctomycetota bacterium]
MLVAVLWGGAPTGALGQGQGPLVEEELPTWTAGEQALIEGLRQVRAEALDLDELPAELIADLAGRAAAEPELLDLALVVLETEAVPSATGSADQRMSQVQEAVILEVFASARRSTAVAARDRYLAQVRKNAWLQDPEAPLDPDGARTALLVTGALGRPQDVALMISLAPEEPGRGGPFERALTRSLRSDPECFERLRGAWLGGGDEIAATCIDAVGAAGDSRALVFLEDVMRWSELLRPNAAAAVQAIGRGLDADRNESLALYLVDLLDPSQPQVCRAAAQALGSLGDEHGYAPLIDLLDEEDPRLREGALWALRRATGLGLGAQSHPWRIWLADERSWHAERAGALYTQLKAENPAARVGALSLLAQQRTGRAAIAERILPLLVDPETAVVTAACRALARLDHVEAVGALFDTMDEREDEAGTAAWQALVQITGLNLPADATLWRTALATRAA